MPEFKRRQVMMLGAGLAVSACSLPRGAARESEIVKNARTDQLEGFAVYHVTRGLVPVVAKWPMTGSGPRGGWLSHGGAQRAPVIAIGDRLHVVIWDSESNSLLMSPEQKAVTLSDLVVDERGGVFVPYIKHITVAGKTVEEARKLIQEKMIAITPSAQVQLTVEPGRHNSVELVGGVGKPGSYPLFERGVTLLSLISQAGGVQSGLRNPIVRLSRGGRIYVTTVSKLYANPSFDTVLRGGDKVIVEPDPRNFIAIGAARREQLVQFPKDDVSALDAVAEIGGINDFRADPKGILVLRQYDQKAVSKTDSGPSQAQAIFIIDLTSADGLFAAHRFQIHPDDVVYVSESPLTTIDTISGILGTILGLGRRSQVLSNN
ncbi:polysaccharide biosynthesis/export family protein [Acidimangrovimonas pyrenivorans]|uniref:Polysaccharide biosynthesis/export family protein n=1 Tax=Acidimangrovimonas pyrenivorans TaxID=2030798 RepID=A0ABV7AD57_9RHOB